MDVFGRTARPRLVNLKRRRVAGAIALTWDVRGGRALRWRVLRSAHEFAAGPFDDTVVGRGQTLVSDQARPGSHDDLAALGSPGSPPATLFYTVFSEDERGTWRRQARLRLKAGDPVLGRRSESDFEAGATGSGWLDKGWIARAGSGDNPDHP
jgi:hypothetical protein